MRDKNGNFARNTDITYCNGSKCAVRESCFRYTEGVAIRANVEGDTNQYWWMDHCDESSRDGYWSVSADNR